MPSSSWRLIHEVGAASPSVPSMPSTPASTQPPATPGRAVLRGQSRNGSRGSTPPVMPQPGPVAPADPAPEEPTFSAEEIQRLEREAETRGYQDGVMRAEAELRGSVDAAGALVERLQSIAPERTSDIAHAIAELALSVAKRVVQHEVRLEPSLLCAALESAVSTINGSPEAHVLLNPACVTAVAEAWEARHGRHYLGKKWTFEGDPTLPIGGCTLRYDHGFVEAGLESQLEEIGIALDRAIPSLARSAVEEGAA